MAFINNSDPDSGIEALQEAEELIAERKKKIRIAVSSKAGWVTVSKLNKKGIAHLSSEQQKDVKIAEEDALKDLDSRKRKKRDLQHHGFNSTPHLPDRRLRGTHSYTLVFFSLQAYMYIPYCLNKLIFIFIIYT